MLKQRPCPYCGKVGTLNIHDKIYGNKSDDKTDRCLRGQRGWCSNRGKRGGCGKTISFVFSWVLPRHSFTADILDHTLTELSSGSSVKTAHERCRTLLSLQGLYHLIKRFSLRIDALRTKLIEKSKPTVSTLSDPILQTFQHLQTVFSLDPCAISAYQQDFQVPIMG